MATKAKPPVDEQFEEETEVKLFDLIEAIDRKDYDYYSRLNATQQKKVALFILVHWTSAIKGNGPLSAYYLQSVDFYANTHLFNENVAKHPDLIWKMLCASSPGRGKQFHQWIPGIKARVSTFREVASLTDAKTYFAKVYPKASAADVGEVSKEYVVQQKRKCRLAAIYPSMKIADLEILNSITDDETLAQYELDCGN